MPLPLPLAEFRRAFPQIASPSRRASTDRVGFGVEGLDCVLQGGLARAGLHEICAPGAAARPAATLVALGLAWRAAAGKPVFWVRQDSGRPEVGGPYPAGLAELGLAPDRLVLMRGRDTAAVLRAGVEAARCGALGAVLIEPWGSPAANASRLDLTTSRRLLLAAESAGVFTLLMRADGPVASAALTRWRAEPLPSRPREAGAPGDPAFRLTLLRHRGGQEGGEWNMEWHRDRRSFQPWGQPETGAGTGRVSHGAALSGAVAAFPGDRPAPAPAEAPLRRRAG